MPRSLNAYQHTWLVGFYEMAGVRSLPARSAHDRMLLREVSAARPDLLTIEERPAPKGRGLHVTDTLFAVTPAGVAYLTTPPKP